MTGSVGAGVMGKLNLPGANRQAYQPGMYQPRATETDAMPSDRSYVGRFGAMKEVSASVDLANPKFADSFKSKYGLPGYNPGSGVEPSQGGNTLDTSMHSAKKLSTPSSIKKSDSDDEERH